MNERKRTRVTGRIMYNGLANFYEITLNGLNSLMRLYDANAKLVMSRRMILPDNCQVIPCQNYIIYFTPQHIFLTDLSSMGFQAVSAINPGINQIIHCQYNSYLNVFFISDDQKRIFYFLHTASKIQVRRLVTQQDIQVPNQIEKMYVYRPIMNNGHSQQINNQGNQPDIYLFYQELRMLLQISIDYRTDQIRDINKIQGVYDIFYYQGWELMIREKEELIHRQSSMDEERYHEPQLLQLTIKNPGQFSKTISQQFLPLKISANQNEILILDQQHRNIMFIYQKQFYSFTQSQLIFGAEAYRQITRDNYQFIFKIAKTSFSHFKVTLWAYDEIKSIFTEFSATFDSASNSEFHDENQKTVLYIHNNIHLIFADQFIDEYFEDRIVSFLKIKTNRTQDDLRNRDLLGFLFYVLLRDYPDTILKLAGIIVDKSIVKMEISEGFSTKRYLILADRILSDIIQQIMYAYSEYFEKDKDIINIYQEQPQQCLENSQQLKQNRQRQLKYWKMTLRYIIKFISIFRHAILTEDLALNHCDLEKSQEDTGQAIYTAFLQRAKSVYICLQGLEKLMLDGLSISAKDWIIKIGNKDSSSILRFFNQQLIKKPSQNKLFTCMINSQKYIEAAFIYCCLFSSQSSLDNSKVIPYFNLDNLPVIPYFNNSAYRQIISFFHCCEPHQTPNQISTIVSAYLPRIVSQTLVMESSMNKPFLKQALTLSIAEKEYISSWGILQSEICFEWGKQQHQALGKTTTQEQYTNQLCLIVSCYCQCKKYKQGYNFLNQMEKLWKDKQKSQSITKRLFRTSQHMIKVFIQHSIKNDSLISLFQILTKQEHRSIIIQQLKTYYPHEQVQEIERIAMRYK